MRQNKHGELIHLEAHLNWLNNLGGGITSESETSSVTVNLKLGYSYIGRVEELMGHLHGTTHSLLSRGGHTIGLIENDNLMASCRERDFLLGEHLNLVANLRKDISQTC